jgi:hypothetical protein
VWPVQVQGVSAQCWVWWPATSAPLWGAGVCGSRLLLPCCQVWLLLVLVSVGVAWGLLLPVVAAAAVGTVCQVGGQPLARLHLPAAAGCRGSAV